MQLSIAAIEGQVCSLRSEGEIRMGDTRSQVDPIDGLLGAYRKDRVILLDLSRTTYIDSSGVGWLVKHHKLANESGGTLILHSVPPQVQSIFKLLHLQSIFHIAEDERAAKALAQASAAPAPPPAPPHEGGPTP
jgi:anti-sigma B factor antagonist